MQSTGWIKVGGKISGPLSVLENFTGLFSHPYLTRHWLVGKIPGSVQHLLHRGVVVSSPINANNFSKK